MQLAFECVGLKWKDYVVIDKTFYRPAEVNLLQGDCSKARKHFGWKPTVKFEELVRMMVEADVDRIKEK